MLDHLLEVGFEPEVLGMPVDDFTPIGKVGASDMLDAQMETTEWLRSIGASDDSDTATASQQALARDAFKAMTSTPASAKEAISKVTQPAAVRQIVGMLASYDWAFVEQAQQLRSMAVAKIVEETEHPDARIRLKALELLGRVTEVGLFTDRIEVKKTDMTDQDLDARIKEKLAILNKHKTHTPSHEVVDAEYTVQECKT